MAAKISIAELNLKKTSTTDVMQLLLNGGFTIPSRKEKKELQKRITNAVTDGDFNLALNNLAMGLYFDVHDTFDNIRRKGLFRYSRYTGRKCIVKDLATRLLAICIQLGFNTTERETYLNSIINYSSVLTSFNNLDSLMIKEMRHFEHKYKGRSLVKSLLSFVDFLFLSNYFPDPKADLTDISAWSKEEISAAVSYLIFLYTSRINTRTVETMRIAEDFLKSSEVSVMVVAACTVVDFKDFEINIDHFGYSCIPSNDNLLIKAPFEDFEKAIRLGYIRTDIQQMNDQVETVRKLKGVSMDMLIDKLNEKIDFKFFKFMAGDYSRYRIEMPDPVFDMLVKDFFKPDALFDDEIVYLSQIFKEQLLNHKDLAAMKISEDLSLFEFIKIRRVFLLFYVLFAKQVYTLETLDRDVLLRSLIFRFPENDLHTMIEKLVPAAKLDAFFDLVCWESGLETVFDLQYRPILFFEDHFLVALSILANSNTIRNLFASEYKQDNKAIMSDGSIDPLADKLNYIMQKAKLASFTQTPVNGTDLDVFAVYGNTLFVFECKHSLHPVSSYDLRTTFDYIKKAETQLDKIMDEFNADRLVPVLEKKHGISLQGVDNIQPCIVLSNRLFNGNIFRYPVRNINEIENMFNGGILKTTTGEYWLWPEKKLTLKFLLNYFSMKNELVDLHYNSLQKRTMVYNLTSPAIEYEVFSLDFAAATTLVEEFAQKLEKLPDEEG